MIREYFKWTQKCFLAFSIIGVMVVLFSFSSTLAAEKKTPTPENPDVWTEKAEDWKCGGSEDQGRDLTTKKVGDASIYLSQEDAGENAVFSSQKTVDISEYKYLVFWIKCNTSAAWSGATPEVVMLAPDWDHIRKYRHGPLKVSADTKWHRIKINLRKDFSQKQSRGEFDETRVRILIYTRKEKAPYTVWIDGLYFEKQTGKASSQDALQLTTSADFDKEILLYEPGEKVSFSYIVNSPNCHSPIQGNIQVTNFFDEIIKEIPVTLNFDSGGEWCRKIVLQETKHGIYYVEFVPNKESINGKKITIARETQAQFGIFKSGYLDRGDSKFWSTNTSLRPTKGNWKDRNTAIIKTAARMGLTKIRMDALWPYIQPRPDRWRWEVFDFNVDTLLDHGITPYFILCYTASWCAGMDPDLRSEIDNRRIFKYRLPSDMKAWEKYVRTVVNRYKDRIKCWEIWNEPDWAFWRGAPEDYLYLLKATYETIKGIDPSLKVCLGGLSSMRYLKVDDGELKKVPRDALDKRITYDFAEVVLKEGKEYFDILPTHNYYYGDVDELDQGKRRKMELLIKKYDLSDKIEWNNECGIKIDDRSQSGRFFSRTGEFTQATSLIKLAAWTKKEGMEQFGWFKLWHAVSLGEKSRGLIDIYDIGGDFTLVPTAGYFAYSTGVKHLSGVKFLRSKSYFDGQIKTYSFRKKNKKIWMLWCKPGSQSTMVNIHMTSADDIYRYDIMGRKNTVNTDRRARFVLKISKSPIFLETNDLNAKVRSLENFVADVPVSVALETDKATETYLGKIKNFYSRPLKIKINNLSRQHYDTFSDFNLKIEGKGSATLKVPLKFPTSKIIHPLKFSIQLKDITLQYHVNVLQGKELSPFPDRMNLDSDFRKYEPTWTLNASEDYYQVQSKPEWTGTSDASCQGWFFYSKGRIFLFVDATDDIFYQPFDPINSWRGDSMQVAFVRLSDNRRIRYTVALVSGKPIVHVYEGKKITENMNLEETLDIEKYENGLVYKLSFPLEKFLKTNRGFRFNFIVNDNDGNGRKGWMRLAPGIGTDVRNFSNYPNFIVPESGL